mgnify:CR=1 FL=1
MDPKEPKEPGAEVFSLDEARKKADQKGEGQAVQIDGAEFLKPVMAAIARELAEVADPDGVVRVGGSDEASRAKTAAVVKGLGIGLGQALAEAFGKYAQKIETGQATPPMSGTITTTPAPGGDDDKKPS